MNAKEREELSKRMTGGKEPGSWIIRNKKTKIIFMETFTKKTMEKFQSGEYNSDEIEYEVLPIAAYLAEMNEKGKSI